MLSYIALLVGTISAIVGVLVKPTTKTTDGVEHFNNWVVLFILLPMVSFGIGALQYYRQSNDNNSLTERLHALQVSVESKHPVKAAG
jgi:hypothetical protein